MSYTKFTPLSYIDQIKIFNQAVNVFLSAVKLGILTWRVYATNAAFTCCWELS